MTTAGSSSCASSSGPAVESARRLPSFVAFARDIKLAHSVFALPFAAAALVVGRLGWPSARQGALLLICMVAARSFAMGMNRFLDRKIDAENPRTRGRMIPAGGLAPAAGLSWSLAAAATFMVAAAALSPLAGWCAAPLLLILASYSLLKKVAWITHWYLGICLGLAPVGVAVALSGSAPVAVLLVGAAVALWTAGFDLLYALQDAEFDRGAQLKSFPARFGARKSVITSRMCFASMIALLGVAGDFSQAGVAYFIGVAAVAAMLAYEQWLVRDASATGGSKNLGVAFFNMNAYVSFIFLAFVLVDAWLGRGA